MTLEEFRAVSPSVYEKFKAMQERAQRASGLGNQAADESGTPLPGLGQYSSAASSFESTDDKIAKLLKRIEALEAEVKLLKEPMVAAITEAIKQQQ